MDRDKAEKIVAENEDYELREGYSGRFMYGAETTAVIVPTRDDVGYVKKKYGGYLSSDNMALDYIVY